MADINSNKNAIIIQPCNYIADKSAFSVFGQSESDKAYALFGVYIIHGLENISIFRIWKLWLVICDIIFSETSLAFSKT